MSLRVTRTARVALDRGWAVRTRCLSSQTELHVPLWLDGAEASALDGNTLPIEDPSTAVPFATTALGSEADIDRAVASAKACHDEGTWRAMGARGRGRVLRNAADLLRQRLPELIDLETRSTGRPKREYTAQLGRYARRDMRARACYLFPTSVRIELSFGQGA